MRKIVRKYYFTNMELADAAENISLEDVDFFIDVLLISNIFFVMIFLFILLFY